jgi:hypothetical protein
MCLSSGERPDDRDPARRARARQTQYLGAALAQRFHGQEIVGHR